MAGHMSANRTISLKKHVSTGLLFVAAVLLVSGIALFTAPSCRVAELIGWSFCFLGKESWESVHVTFALLFFIASILHVALNWSPLVSYIRGDGGIAGYRIALVCALTVIFLFIAAALDLPPVSWLYRAHEHIKFSWGPRCADAEGARPAPNGTRGAGYRPPNREGRQR